MWEITGSEEIAGDASGRRYRRVRLKHGATAVEVVYPGGRLAALARDLEVRAWLEARGLRVPRLLGLDLWEGRALLEDFGPLDAAAKLAVLRAEARPEAAARLVAPLRLLAEIPLENCPAWNEPLDRGRLRWELAGFELWFLRYGLAVAPPPAVSAWLDGLALRAAGHPRRVCHRDYHLNNLFFLETGEVGVIDFQDLLLGPDTYDLASLVGERDFPDLVGDPGRELVVEAWAEGTGPAPGWERRLQEILVQRGLKVLGTFARLVAVGHERYGRWMPPLCARTARNAAALGAPRELVDLLLQWQAERG